MSVGPIRAEPLVVLHVWGVPAAAVPASLAAMGRDRRPVRRSAGLRFAKLLGTGDGQTFTMRDADPRHWALLTVWDDGSSAAAFEHGPVVRRWDRRAEERLRVALHPLSSKGQWAGERPFGDPRPTARHHGPVAAITRARLRASRARTFWRAVPPVSAELRDAPGLRLSLGIGEAPVGLQGTFSLWESGAALTAFAARGAAHVEAVRRTAEVGWYAEELFARFAVLAVEGTYRDSAP